MNLAGDVSGQIVVFAGPSLPPRVRPEDPRFTWLAPAVAGDAYRLEHAGPKAVVLIDGLFDAWPAIRHKELLQLMARGVPVIGAASMGALRAAELHDFGMIGVGRIFQAYVSGALIGDDEVAVMHGPEEMDWAALTEAMVNVRATVLRAVRRGIVHVRAGRFILRTAKATFYKERTWAGLIGAMKVLGARSPGQVRALENWLPHGRVNLKQVDALAALATALRLVSGSAASPPFPPQTLFATALAEQVSKGVTGLERLSAPH
jgi:hypothetical protein